MPAKKATTRKPAHRTQTQTAIVACCTPQGSAIIFGWVDKLPKPGGPVTLYDAQMVLAYPSGGTLGLAVSGPPKGSRVTRAVVENHEAVCPQYQICTPEAVAAFEAYA